MSPIPRPLNYTTRVASCFQLELAQHQTPIDTSTQLPPTMSDQQTTRSESSSSADPSPASSSTSLNEKRSSRGRSDSCTHVFPARPAANGRPRSSKTNSSQILEPRPSASNGLRGPPSFSVNDSNMFFSGLDWLLEATTKQSKKP